MLCVRYLASWEDQDLSITHQRCASTEWLVFSWTFQHRMLSIDLSWVEPSIYVHWKTTTMKCLSSRSLSGRHSKDVFLPRMANTDWSYNGQGPPFIEDFCTKMKINNKQISIIVTEWDIFKISLPALDGRHRLKLYWTSTRTKFIRFDWWFWRQFDLSSYSGHLSSGQS